MLNHSPGPLVTVLTLLTDDSGRSLLTHDADDHKATWALPGGALCPGELPTVAAHRALCDQLDLGLTFAETDLLAHEWRVQQRHAELVYLFTAPPLTAVDAVHSVLKPRKDTAYCWAEHERALDLLGDRERRPAARRAHKRHPSPLPGAAPTHGRNDQLAHEGRMCRPAVCVPRRGRPGSSLTRVTISGSGCDSCEVHRACVPCLRHIP